jgi:UDP:flavonoid glycosyltransferase YjiC (YdhE family)
MKITINAFGSRGDVQPYVALGKGLRAAGFEVLITTHKIFEKLTLENGLDCYPIDANPHDVLVSQAVADIGNNPVKISRWMAKNINPIMKDMFQITLESGSSADLIVNSLLSFAGYHVGEKLGIPSIGAFLQPATPTRFYPGASGISPPGWMPFKGVFNYSVSKLTNQFLFNLLRPVINECRADVLGLPTVSARFYWRVDKPSNDTPILYGYSPSVMPKPADWGPGQSVTGYWFLEKASDYNPPSDLTEFLQTGPDPIYIGFGSMVDHEKEKITELVFEAIELAGQRAILLGGWSDLGAGHLPDHIFRIDFAPHDWLFPRMRAVVHHGGAGTTAAGLQAGAPNVIIPFFGDQAFWAWRVDALGVGVKGVPRKRLTSQKLAEAINQAVGDEEIRANAAELGVRIRSENGVETAVAHIERILA